MYFNEQFIIGIKDLILEIGSFAQNLKSILRPLDILSNSLIF